VNFTYVPDSCFQSQLVGSTTRRNFLSIATVVAGGTVLAPAAIPPVIAAAAPAGPLDPIFGIIDAHRAAGRAHLDAIDEQGRLEELDETTVPVTPTNWRCLGWADECEADYGGREADINAPFSLAPSTELIAGRRRRAHAAMM
jgi:hypothetical protein